LNVAFSESSQKEIETLQKKTGLSVAEILQYGFSLFRMYVNEIEQGKEFRIIDPTDPRKQVKIDLQIGKKNA
jgi:hypothetical protein